MWKTVGTILLVAFVVVVGKILLREYVRHETGKGVAVSAQDDVAVSAKSKDYEDEYLEVCTDGNMRLLYLDGVSETCIVFINEAKRDCGEGEANACSIVGRYYYDRRDYTKPQLYFEKACNLGRALSCHTLGMLYWEGLYLVGDLKKAMKYFDRGCELDWESSCFVLGTLYEGEVSVQDLDMAIKYYKKSCDLESFGFGSGCDNYKELTGLNAR